MPHETARNLLDGLLSRVPLYRYVTRLLLDERHAELGFFLLNAVMALALATMLLGTRILTLVAEVATALMFTILIRVTLG